jgi:hypothetical protein
MGIDLHTEWAPVCGFFLFLVLWTSFFEWGKERLEHKLKRAGRDGMLELVHALYGELMNLGIFSFLLFFLDFTGGCNGSLVAAREMCERCCLGLSYL